MSAHIVSNMYDFENVIQTNWKQTMNTTTFSLFGIDELNNLSPSDIYAVHCAWEMDIDDYENPKTGLAVLQKHNSDFGK